MLDYENTKDFCQARNLSVDDTKFQCFRASIRTFSAIGRSIVRRSSILKKGARSRDLSRNGGNSRRCDRATNERDKRTSRTMKTKKKEFLFLHIFGFSRVRLDSCMVSLVEVSNKCEDASTSLRAVTTSTT